MGFFDSLSSIFGSGGGTTAAASASPNPWMVGASILGGILSQRRATPNPGASRSDIERANRFNMIASLLGGGLQAYGQYNLANDAQQQRQNALAGLMDIYSKGGIEQQGSMPDGSAMPKLGLSRSLMQYGAQNPAIQEDALKLGLQSMAADREQERWDQELGFRREGMQAEQKYRDAMLAQNRAEAAAMAAHRNATLGLQQQELGLRKQEAEFMKPIKEAQVIGSIYGEDVARAYAQQQRLGLSPQPPQGNGLFTPVNGGQSTPPPTTDRLTQAMQQAQESRMREQQFQDSLKVQQDVGGWPEFKNLSTAKTYFDAAIANLQKDDPVANQAGIIAMAKIYDPLSVTREGEILMTERNRGVYDILAGALSKAKGQGYLDPQTRGRLLGAMGEQMGSLRSQYDARLLPYRSAYETAGRAFSDPAGAMQLQDLAPIIAGLSGGVSAEAQRMKRMADERAQLMAEINRRRSGGR